jgi:hypothetical protein
VVFGPERSVEELQRHRQPVAPSGSPSEPQQSKELGDQSLAVVRMVGLTMRIVEAHMKRTSKSRSKMVKVTLSAVMVIGSMFLATQAFAVSRTFDFDDCRWRSEADDNHSKAWTITRDLDGGCSYLDADLKYFDGAVRTKYCSWINTQSRGCSKSWVDHEQSRSAAKSWETGRAQYSGWWG